MFPHCYAGEVGSNHEARVLSEIWTYLTQLQNEKFPDDTHIVGDKAYPCIPQLMTPFRNNGHLTARQENYNYLLCRVRNTVERAFALLKKKKDLGVLKIHLMYEI
jgi:hypothetical protein